MKNLTFLSNFWRRVSAKVHGQDIGLGLRPQCSDVSLDRREHPAARCLQGPRMLSSSSGLSANGVGSLMVRVKPRITSLRFASALLLFLTLGIGNAWGADLTTADLDFGTPAASENFEDVAAVTTSGKSGSITTVTNYTKYGLFTHGYIGKSTSDSYAVKAAATPMTSKYLEITTTTKGAIMSFSRTFATKGALSFKIARSSVTYIGLYGAVANSTFYAKANSSVYLYFTGSKIQINSGSGWIDAVTTLPSTTTMDITVIYNNTATATTYGDGVSLAAKTAHIFVNGTAIMNGSSPKAFTIPGASLTAFRVGCNLAGTSKVDDIKIYDALPEAAATCDAPTAPTKGSFFWTPLFRHTTACYTSCYNDEFSMFLLIYSHYVNVRFNLCYSTD